MTDSVTRGLASFSAPVREWFLTSFGSPTEAQNRAWPAIQAGRHVLLAAPTGSGKTLAAFLAALDSLAVQAEAGELGDATQVVYVSPLKALSNDILRNLQEPLAGIATRLRPGANEIRAMVRTGDTPARERASMRKLAPHIVVTTPESLYVLLTSVSGQTMLASTRTLIVDEIHAVAGSKRGSHLALSMERLAALCGDRLQRIGLSATQKPIEEVACFLTGAERAATSPCVIVDTGYTRERDLALAMPASPLQPVMSNEVWEEVYDRLGELVSSHRTTLVFVNTRRMAERVTRHLSERVGREYTAAHHGSLAREQRWQAEQRLKRGELRVLVATASLELGIDIGEVDLVCQLGSPRAIATLLQRVGRSGHAVDGLPRGRLFPLSRDDLVECTALLAAVSRQALDKLRVLPQPLDVLAQQVVAMVACREWDETALFECVRQAYPYRDLSRDKFNDLVRMLAEGFSTRRGRQSAYLHRDAVNGRLRARRGALLAAVTCGGAIPDTADYEVREEPAGIFVGTVNEDFAMESLAGDIFQLGNTSWRILRVEAGVVRVQDAHGQPPNIPFWFGEAPARTDELSQAVAALRKDIDRLLQSGGANAARLWLKGSVGIPAEAAMQLVEYLATARAALEALPTQSTLVLERFFDESGGMQLVLHSPFGSRINRAWGLALRKRFCQSFNFELQAAATDDAIVLSLGETHSFPLRDVWGYLRAATVPDLLTQAVLDAPMFTTRWRWNATVALAIPRFRSGRKVPPRLQRMNAEDLVAVVFPDQIACLENVVGKRTIPDHPLVEQTLWDCLHEAMDLPGLQAVLGAIESRRLTLIARDLTEPSPLAQEILSARPYAFLDDAPLEERRTQAVISRRWLDPHSAADLGRLDAAAIAAVKEEAWPLATTHEELHDALLLLTAIELDELRTAVSDRAMHDWSAMFQILLKTGRAAVVTIASDRRCWVATERLPVIRGLFPDASVQPEVTVPPEFIRSWSREEALIEWVRATLSVFGPVTLAELSAPLSLPGAEVLSALLRLESEGFVLRGSFRPEASDEEWCERRLLARMHQYTVRRLRREIEPVSITEFMRFLLRWQRVDGAMPLQGLDGLAAVVAQLEGFQAPFAAWERDLLPARLSHYEPAWLDQLCLTGQVTWRRWRVNDTASDTRSTLLSTAGIVLLQRRYLAEWCDLCNDTDAQRPVLSSEAERVLTCLSQEGASFLEDIMQATRLLRTQVEIALGELVAKGMVHADSFMGLRGLLRTDTPRRTQGRRQHAVMQAFGRWSLARAQATAQSLEAEKADWVESAMERVARTLLLRYGVVMRAILVGESRLPPWRDLVRVYRRLEARGEIRGGRFVASVSGEQFALPEAVGLLRDVKRQGPDATFCVINATDPLNLTGNLILGDRIPATVSNRLLFKDGMLIAALQGKLFRCFTQAEADDLWEYRQRLLRSPRSVKPFRAGLRLAAGPEGVAHAN